MRFIIIVIACFANFASGTSAVDEQPKAQKTGSGDALLRNLVETLGTGDQRRYETFVAENYSPRTLSGSSVEDEAATLARIFADTGGFDISGVLANSRSGIVAEARDQTAGLRHCLTLKLDQDARAPMISEFGVRAIYPAGPQLAAAKPAEVVKEIERVARAFDQRGLLSGVVLVGHRDEIIFERAYGRASLAFDRPVTKSTRFNIASIGKRLTGVAIGQLVDDAKLSYDDPVGKYLPDFPDAAIREDVTIRRLLAHTSGLGPEDYYELPDWNTARPQLRSVADYMKLAAKTPMKGEPGEYRYSNSGYVILGGIIEKVSGEDFYDFIARRIFEPAGMTNSFYHEMDAEDADVATPLTNLFNKTETGFIYRLSAPRSAVYELPARGGPQGGAYMTAEDLFAFEKAFRDGKLVSDATMREIITPQSGDGAGAGGLTGDVREGLGIEIVRQNGNLIYGHTGGDLGIATLSYYYPDSEITTIILTNRDPRAARVLANVTRAILTRRTGNGATPPPQACAIGG